MLVALRFASATAYLFLVSGWLILLAVFGARRFRPVETAALAFITSLSLTSLLAGLAHLAGASLDFVLYGHLAISVVAGIVAAVRAPSTEPAAKDGVRWDYFAVGVVALAAAIAWIEGLWLRMSDLFYHLAAVQSLLVTNKPLVTDPMFGLKGLAVDPTSGTFHTFLALAARLGGARVLQTFSWLEGVVVAWFLLTFYVFARRLLGSGGKALAALVLFAAVVWSADFRVVIYPKWLDPAVYWAGLFFLLGLMERFDWRALAFLVAFGVTIVLVHLGTAELWVITVAAMVFWSVVLVRRIEDGRGVALRCLIGSGLSVAVMAPILYRRSASVLIGARTSVFNPPAGLPMSTLPTTTIARGLVLIRGGRWYQGGDLMLAFVVLATSVVLAGIVSRRGKATDIALVAGASIMPVAMLNLVAGRLLVAKYWFHLRRMAALLKFVPALLAPAVFGLARDESSRRKSTDRDLTLMLVAGVTALAVGAAAISYVGTVAAFERFASPGSVNYFGRSRYNVARTTAGIVGYLQDHAKPTQTVAAPQDLSYYMAALVPVRVIAVNRSHMPLAVEVRSGERRRSDQAQIFNPRVTLAKTARLLEKYQASYIVLARGGAAAGKFERLAGVRRVYVDTRYVIFAIDRSLGASTTAKTPNRFTSARRWDTMPQGRAAVVLKSV